MRIRIYVKDLDTGNPLEELGSCLTDSPNRAIQMYDQDQKWIDDGYNADIAWDDITNQAARALGSIKSKRKAKSSAVNGRLGGHPKKTK